LEYIEDYVRLRPKEISVNKGTEAASVFIATANKLNILGEREDGTLFLFSADANYSSKEQLSPSEAYSWTQLALTNNLIQLNKNPNDLVWPDGVIPVFSGKLGVQFSLGVLNGSDNPDGAPGTFDFTAASLFMGADGSLYAYLNQKISGPQECSYASIIYYQTMLIPNVRTSDERNS
jgi:hypothetical protein